MVDGQVQRHCAVAARGVGRGVRGLVRRGGVLRSVPHIAVARRNVLRARVAVVHGQQQRHRAVAALRREGVEAVTAARRVGSAFPRVFVAGRHGHDPLSAVVHGQHQRHCAVAALRGEGVEGVAATRRVGSPFPQVFVAGRHRLDALSAVVHGQVQRRRAVAPRGVGAGVRGLICRGGVLRAVPRVAVARRHALRAAAAAPYGQRQRHRAVAPLRREGVVAVAAARRVGRAFPCVFVASRGRLDALAAVVHGQRQRHRAVAALRGEGVVGVAAARRVGRAFPGVFVASRQRFAVLAAVVHGQRQRRRAVAAGRVGRGVGVLAALRDCLAVPQVAVARRRLHLGHGAVEHRQVQHVAAVASVEAREGARRRVAAGRVGGSAPRIAVAGRGLLHYDGVAAQTLPVGRQRRVAQHLHLAGVGAVAVAPVAEHIARRRQGRQRRRVAYGVLAAAFHAAVHSVVALARHRILHALPQLEGVGHRDAAAALVGVGVADFIVPLGVARRVEEGGRPAVDGVGAARRRSLEARGQREGRLVGEDEATLAHRNLGQAVHRHRQLVRHRAVCSGTRVVHPHLGTYAVALAQVAQVDGVGRQAIHQAVVAVPLQLRPVVRGPLRGGHKAHLLAGTHVVPVARYADRRTLRAAHHDGLAVRVLARGVVAYAQRQLVDARLRIGVDDVALRVVILRSVALHVPAVLRQLRRAFGPVQDDDLLALAHRVAPYEREHRRRRVAVGLDVGGTPHLASPRTDAQAVQTVARGHRDVAEVHQHLLAGREGDGRRLAVAGVAVPVVFGIVGSLSHEDFVEVGRAPLSVARACPQGKAVHTRG